MAYLSRLKITLDEEDALLQDDGTIVDNIGTDEPVAAVIEVGSAISAQDADDEIQEEAVAIESDLEAMQEGTDAVSELQEQNEVHEELLSQPEVITPEVAVTTQDAFVITLAKLKITPEMAFQSRISLDACTRDPYRIVKITNDGVKEFLARIKEHIVAFFRSIKKKMMGLIAKLATWFSASIEKVDALVRRMEKGKLADGKFDISKREIGSKFFDIMPLSVIFILANNGNLSVISYLKELTDKLKTKPSDHLNILKEILITNTLDTYISNKGSIGKVDDYVSKVNDVISKLSSNTSKVIDFSTISMDDLKRYLEQKYLIGEHTDKTDYKYSNPFLITDLVGDSLMVYRIGVSEATDSKDIPEIFSTKVSVTQAGKDKALESLGDKHIYSGSDVAAIIKDLRNNVKGASAWADALYKSLGDDETTISNKLKKLEANDDDEYKDGRLIKMISQLQMALAKATFTSVMAISKIVKLLLKTGNLAIDAIETTKKEDRKESKRTGEDVDTSSKSSFTAKATDNKDKENVLKSEGFTETKKES